MTKKNKIPSFLYLSVIFTLLTYLVNMFDLSVVDSLYTFFLLGIPSAKEPILNSSFFQYIPNFFPIVVWAAIGLGCYLLYYSLRVTYYYMHNFFSLKLFYHKADTSKNGSLEISRKNRILVHLIVITIYVSLVVFYVVFAMPIAVLLYRLFYPLWTPYFPLFTVLCLWLLIFYILSFIFKVIKKYFDQEKFLREHFPQGIKS